MRGFSIGCAILVMVQIGAAYAQTDECADPWINVTGTYRCDGKCSYTAAVCTQPDYTVGVRRWQFRKEGVSATGIQVVSGSKSINFATKPGWEFRTASTKDCAATITFDGLPNGEQVVWKRVDSGPAECGGGRRRRR